MQWNIMGQTPTGLSPDVTSQTSTIIRPDVQPISLDVGPNIPEKEFYDRTQKYEISTDSPGNIDYGPGQGDIPQSLDTDVTHTSSEILTPEVYESTVEPPIQVATGPEGPGGDLDLAIDPGSDVGQVLDTLSRWGMVDTVVDANNHVSATLTQKGKTTLWGGAAAIGGYILFRKFGAKKPRKKTYRKKKKK